MRSITEILSEGQILLRISFKIHKWFPSNKLTYLFNNPWVPAWFNKKKEYIENPSLTMHASFSI